MGRNARRKHEQRQKGGRESDRRPLRRSRRKWIFRTLLALAVITGVIAWQWKGTLWGYKKAPSFTLKASTGQLVSLQDYLGKQEVVGQDYLSFGLSESHLWAFAVAQAGFVRLEIAVRLVMALSTLLLLIAAILLIRGWIHLYQAQDGLATHGLYACLRHPQYVALILGVVAFNIQWPTFLTLLMAPVLIIMYIRLAKREEKELAERFGEVFRHYQRRVPGFLPRLFAHRET